VRHAAASFALGAGWIMLIKAALLLGGLVAAFARLLVG